MVSQGIGRWCQVVGLVVAVLLMLGAESDQISVETMRKLQQMGCSKRQIDALAKAEGGPCVAAPQSSSCAAVSHSDRWSLLWSHLVRLQQAQFFDLYHSLHASSASSAASHSFIGDSAADQPENAKLLGSSLHWWNISSAALLKSLFPNQLSSVAALHLADVLNSVPTVLTAFRLPAAGLEICHFAYAKTHKTASDTLANAFFRFADERRLFPLLPQEGWELDLKNETALLNLHSLRPQLSFLHTKQFLPQRLSELLPADTVFLSSVRHPYWQQLSSFEYFGEAVRRCGIKPMRYAKSLASRHEVELCLQAMLKEEAQEARVANPQAIDLGVWHSQLDERWPAWSAGEQQRVVARLVAAVAQRFSLLLVSDYLNESLVLLRRLMNWRTLDILYYSSNQQYRRQQLVDKHGHVRPYEEQPAGPEQLKRKLGFPDELLAIRERIVVFDGEIDKQPHLVRKEEGGRSRGTKQEAQETRNEKGAKAAESQEEGHKEERRAKQSMQEAGNEQEEQTKQEQFDKDEAIQKRSPLDWAIFQYANATLHRLIEQEGQSFRKELEGFLAARQQVETFCRDSQLHHCSVLQLDDWQGQRVFFYASHCRAFHQPIMSRLRDHQQHTGPCPVK